MMKQPKQSRRKRDAIRGLFGKTFLNRKGGRKNCSVNQDDEEDFVKNIHTHTAEDIRSISSGITTSTSSDVPDSSSDSFPSASSTKADNTERCHRADAETLLSLLPGFQEAPNLAGGLLHTMEQTLWKP